MAFPKSQLPIRLLIKDLPITVARPELENIDPSQGQEDHFWRDGFPHEDNWKEHDDQDGVRGSEVDHQVQGAEH